MDIADDAEIGEGDAGDDETVERSFLSKKSMYLQNILFIYISKKDEFFLIVFGYY